MDLDDVRRFAEVAKHGSFARAADELGLARSTLSRVIQRLEVELGVVLLHRTTRRVELTPAGADFLARVGPALADVQLAVREMRGRSEEPAGLFRVTTTTDIAVSLLAPVLAELARAHPRLQIETRLTLETVDLVGERFDAALRAYRAGPTDPDLTGRRLAGVAFGWYASPGYLERRGTPRTEAELAMYDVIGSPKLGRRPRMVIDDSLFGLALVRAGAGIGILPVDLGASDPDLVRVLPDLSLTQGELWLVYPTGPVSPALAAFRDAVVRHVEAGTPVSAAP